MGDAEMSKIEPKSGPDAAFRRQVERANRRFGGAEVCHGCQRPLKSGEFTWIGECRRGRLMVVAACCAWQLEVLLGFATWWAKSDLPAELLAELPAEGSA
jgi:hypothetical protein